MKTVPTTWVILTFALSLTGCLSIRAVPDSIDFETVAPARRPAFEAVVEEARFGTDGQSAVNSDSLLMGWGRRLESEGVFSAIFVPGEVWPEDAARVQALRTLAVRQKDGAAVRFFKGFIAGASFLTLSPLMRTSADGKMQDRVSVDLPDGRRLVYEATTDATVVYSAPVTPTESATKLVEFLGIETATRIVRRMLSDPQLRRAAD